MAFRVTRNNGQNFAENIISPALGFNEGTWTVSSGTGSATLDSNIVFSGNNSLKLENTFTANSLVVTNSDQNTVITNDGNYQLSWYAYKNDALFSIGINVLIYKNAVLLDTQFFSLGDEDADLDTNQKWVRFQSDQSYSLVANDIITFQFEIIGIGATRPSTVIYLDGMMLNKSERQNTIVPSFTKSKGVLYNIYTGWAQYGDSQYTLGSPLTVNSGNTSTVDIDGLGSTIKSQLPLDVVDFYDVANSKILPVASGDGFSFTLSFKGQNTATNSYASIGVDIGGSIGEIFERTITFPRGANTEHPFTITTQGYQLNTFLSNGGILKLTSGNGNTSIYDITLQIHRTHKAR